MKRGCSQVSINPCATSTPHSFTQVMSDGTKPGSCLHTVYKHECLLHKLVTLGTTITTSQTVLLSKRLFLGPQRPFAAAGARTGSGPSLLGALRAHVVLEKRLRLRPPAQPGGLALKAAFLPRSFPFQHLSHPGKQREIRSGRWGRSSRETPPRAAPSLSRWAWERERKRRRLLEILHECTCTEAQR